MVPKTCLVDTCFHLEGIPRITLYGDTPLRDYDLVIIDWRDAFKGWLTHDAKLNKPVLPAIRTKKYWDMIRSRNEDIRILAERGASIVCITTPVKEYTDSNRIKISSLDWLPKRLFDPGPIIESSGCSISLVKGNPVDEALKGLIYDFDCNAVFGMQTGYPILMTTNAGGAAGLIASIGNGHIIFLPKFKNQIEDVLLSSVNTPEDIKFINRFLAAVLNSVEKLQGVGIEDVTAPDWIEQMALPGESETHKAIREKEQEIDKIKDEIQVLRGQLGHNKAWRKLLYDKDAGLRDIVGKTLETFGFKAVASRSADNRVDGFFQAPEGYLLVNVEGTDNTPIDKKPLTDLFKQSAEEISERDEEISPVLIGNAYRLKHPKDREDQFSKSVEKIARLHNLGLLTSAELYKAVNYALGNPGDEEFKAQVRKALIEGRGREIRINIPVH